MKGRSRAKPGIGTSASTLTPPPDHVPEKRAAYATGPLAIGKSFGRYHISRLLGVGGMGVVYQAWDDELGTTVAIKVIRPEITDDPHAADQIQRRFKRELMLARQVTHRNVVRIHDMGEIDGIKYITMPYVHGSNLESTIQKSGHLTIVQAVAIAKQIAAGLAAAHEVGVLHRDLKPVNILIDADDNALIADFGIARSISSSPSATVGVVGTIGYMAPEQARADPVDQRADIYAFGLIFFEMLLGLRAAARGETAVADLMSRMQQAPPRVRTVDPAIPEAVDAIIDRCLQADPARRYQTTRELVAALDQVDASGRPLIAPAAGATTIGGGLLSRWTRRPALLGAAAMLLVAVVAAVGMRDRLFGSRETAVPARTASLAILPFRNASGDQSLDWIGPSLAEILRTTVGRSSSLHAVPSDRVHQVLQDLRVLPDANFNPATLRRMADFMSADTIVWGQFVKFGDAVTISATLEDLKAGRSTLLKAEAANQGALIGALDQLAQSIRESLAFSPANVKELQATSFKPSTQSLQALRAFNEGLQFARQSRQSDALKSFEVATREDPNFALAFSRLGQTYAGLNYDNEAERFSRRAVELSQGLPPLERYLILATHARVINDNQKAIESYEQLVKVAPDDPAVHFDLATLYENAGSLDQARGHFAKALETDGKWVEALLAMGRVETKRRDPQGSLDYLNHALSLAVQLENDEAKGRVLQAIGISYKRLNKPEDALRNYNEALAIRRRLGQKGGMAASLAEIAQVQARLGHLDEALKAYTEALELRREIGDKRGIGNSLLDLGVFHTDRGGHDEALALFKEALQIYREVGDANSEALSLNNIGNLYLLKAQYEDALVYFERSLQVREKAKVPADLALTLHNIAETSAMMGQYDQALSSYLRALELWRSGDDKRNMALESYSMGAVFEVQGRYGASLSSREDAVKALRDLRDRSTYLATALSAYGQALTLLGRFDEGARTLDEALALARELQLKSVIAQTLNYQGDNAYYRGDFKAARALFEQAVTAATAAGDRPMILQAKINLAKNAIKEGRLQAALGALKATADESERLGLKALSVESSVSLAEAEIGTKEYARARVELERVLGTAEKLALRPLLVKSHFLLSKIMAQTGATGESARHLSQARGMLDEIRKEARSDALLKRHDLSAVSAEATSSQALR